VPAWLYFKAELTAIFFLSLWPAENIAISGRLLHVEIPPELVWPKLPAPLPLRAEPISAGPCGKYGYSFALSVTFVHFPPKASCAAERRKFLALDLGSHAAMPRGQIVREGLAEAAKSSGPTML
jgi:hypothetical protein